MSNLKIGLSAFLSIGFLATATWIHRTEAATSVYYTFNSPGTLYEASSMEKSTSQYLWLKSGGKLSIANGVGEAAQTSILFSRTPMQNVSAQIYVNRVSDKFPTESSKQPYVGESLITRYKDDNNFYYAGIRADGLAIIKKKTNGIYKTLATKIIFPGTYNSATNPDLIPLGKWIGLKITVQNSSSNVPQISLYTDVGKTGTWQLATSVADDPSKFGAPILESGLIGIQNDYAIAQFDNFLTEETAPTAVIATSPQTSTTTTQTSISPQPTATTSSTLSYDSVVLSDKPVMYLAMGTPSLGSEKDLSGRGHNGAYKGGSPASTKLPNGDAAAAFNGSSQYLAVPSSADLSIPTTGKLTWEAWIRPDTLQFPNDSGYGYIDWMGKCQNYSPTCEWEARMYSTTNPENRTNRLSAYVFNPSAGLGSAADWQPTAGLIKAGQWLHVVAEYDTTSTPSQCSSAYPGSINIWVNGVKQNFAAHAPTGCMSQYKITPKAGNSPLNIGTMALETWFKGAIGKVAIYNRLLTQPEISEHFEKMTGSAVSGSCGDTCSF